MISTRVFVRQASVWASLTPTIEHVTRWLNANAVHTTPPVRALGGDPGKNSLIAEAAFAIAATRDPLPEVVRTEDVAGVRGYLAEFSINPPSADELDAEELLEVAGLARALREMVARFDGTPSYWPPIPGCGVVDAGHADILISDCLVEVKSVSRNFRAPDLRQLITYCAMLDASGTRPMSVGLVNPRLGIHVTASLEFVCQGVSGLSRTALLREVARRMSDLQVSA